MENSFTNKEKLVICSLLIRVMDADNIQKDEEKKLLFELQNKLKLSQSDIQKAQSMPLKDCKKQLIRFSDKKRGQVKELLEEMAKVDGIFVQQEKELIDSLKLDISHYELELIADWRDDRQLIIGYYTKKENGKYFIEDIRSLGFSELTYKDGGEISIEIEKLRSLNENTYYEFSWTIEPKEDKRGFQLIPRDNNYKIVKPKDLVTRLYRIWENSDLDVIKQLSDVQKMVNTQLTASSDGTFIYELLQNANDYPVEIDEKIQLVDVEFHITDGYLIYRHTGRDFSPRNIAAISKMSAGEKKKEKNAIGYKGIGFKTVFSENQYVFLKSGDYTLRFDERITEESSRFPWQIMPIWTSENEVAEEVLEVMSDNDEFRVQMAIRPSETTKLREADKSFEYIFNDIFRDEKDILFIPNIKSVKVFYDGEEQICRIKDPAKWALTKEPLVYKFTDEEVEENNKEMISNKRIPDKYKNFEDTRVSFACLRNGRMLLPVEKARIYCYLPTQVSLGFPFLMNTDMIPTGPRDDFEKKIKFNHKLMKIAGGKLAEWIRSLLKCGEFDLCSVFTIIPSFDEVENYEDFIKEFEEGFDDTLKGLDFIPTETSEYSLIGDTIIDETGITSSGILTDEEFMEIADWDGSLPAKELRKNRKFKSFVKKYINSSNIFDNDSLREMVQRDEFKEWLMIQDNNNKFINYLLEEKLLADFLNEEIFLEEKSCDLFAADKLYFDIDEELKDLSSFSRYLLFLSFETREYFKNNADWSKVTSGQFAEFDANEFIKTTLLSDNWIETIELLGTWDTSFHFYSFLAKKNIVPDNISKLPFFNDEVDAEIIDDFIDKFVFLSSSQGKDICATPWLLSVSFAFISSNYDAKILEFLASNVGIREFSNEIIVNEIILSDDYKDDINEAQQEDDEISRSFVDYCFKYREFINTGNLSSYVLYAADCNGDSEFVLYENHLYFPSIIFDKYSAKKWIGSGWMYCLDANYLKNYLGEAEQSFKNFLHTAFYVDNLNDKVFYKDVVKNHIKDIIVNTSGSNDWDGDKNVDFMSYLDDNYQYIFEEQRDGDGFCDFILLGDYDDGGQCDICSGAINIYAYDDELRSILYSGWFPSDIVNMCSSRYGNSKALFQIKAKKYHFQNFFDDVMTTEMSNINAAITSKEGSIAFHNFIIERKSNLTDTQKEIMKRAKVYLYGSDEACESSEGHHILSVKARELFNTGLVEFSDLDIIDPDYQTETNADYWETRLGNSKFTVNDFIDWLEKNVDSFYNTLENKDSNILFWRWVKDNKISDTALKNLPVLPIFLKQDGYTNSNEAIYLSDGYIEEGGLEAIVKSYHQEAAFISEDYMNEDDEIEDWKNFWINIGVRYEMLDILIDTIDNRLGETYDQKLSATIAKYRIKLDEYYDGELISKLTDLRVKACDGKFYNLADIIYVDCEKSEPFSYIELPNQTTLTTADERKLVMEIIDEIGGCKIEKLTEWQSAKINRYLKIQDEENLCGLLRSIHYEFVDELAEMYDKDKANLQSFDNIKEIMFLNADSEFELAENLTLSSVYNPFCDFEKFGLRYNYLSDLYKKECENDIRSMLNWVFKIHCKFSKGDIENLANREFAIYFWSKYLIKKDVNIAIIRDYINEGLFDEVACVPTQDYMKKPNEIYSISITSYVKSTADWMNKLPLSSLPEIGYNKDGDTLFELLLNQSCNMQLSFQDALYALFKIKGQERRTQILNWMIEAYNDSYAINIKEYRSCEDALWKNTKNEDIHITKLYALEYGNKMLEQYFGTLQQVINKEYFPAGSISFRKACDILQVTTIESKDLIVDPIYDDIDEKQFHIIRDLKIYALILAGFQDSENWATIYDGYREKIQRMNLWRCSAISLRYDKDNAVCQNLKKFYHEKGSTEFYYVNSLDEKRVFKPFVESFIEYIDINEDELDMDFIETVMDSCESALEQVKGNNTLMLDNVFKGILDELKPGKANEFNGNEAKDEDEDEDTIEVGKPRPKFTNVDEDDTNIEDVNAESSGISNGNVNEQEPISQNTPQTSLDEVNSGKDDEAAPISFDTGELQSPSKPNQPRDKNNHGKGAENGITCSNPFSSSPRPNNTSHTGEVKSLPNNPTPPKPIPHKNVTEFGPTGKPRSLEVLEPTQAEINEINRILGEGLSPEEIADHNYLAQLRLYNNLQGRGMHPNESKADFLRNQLKNEHALQGGKYIHKCSAAGGIMYLSPSIWNKIADDRCVVCVYLGAKADEFMYFNSLDEILEWIGEDDIVIKLTGEEKADVIEELYSSVLNGVKGTAYTLIRINSNEKYDSLFAQVASGSIDGAEENLDDYE